MLLSIVTLNYNKSDLTISCVASLHVQLKKEFESGEIELIIVDNASGDESVNKLNSVIKKEDYKNTKVIANKENSGFAKGCNFGAAVSKGEFILFLNNDTIAKDNGVFKMAKYMKENPDIGILGGQLRNSDGTLQSSNDNFYNLINLHLFLFGLQKINHSQKKITEVDWVKGGLLMIRKDIFQKLSGFDENIFMYIEDMELCYRAKLRGYKTMFYPDVNVVHAEHGSTNRSFAIVNIYKGLLYFYKKHKSYPEYLYVKILLLIKAVIAIIIGRVFRNDYLVKTYKQAIKF